MFVKIPKGRAYETVIIGQQIRHLRRLKEMSQKSLAEKIGVSLEWIGRVERGIFLPNLKLLFKIAKALQVPVRELIPKEL
jgi:transcriptional regulator with XRE-family HTH domain